MDSDLALVQISCSHCSEYEWDVQDAKFGQFEKTNWAPTELQCLQAKVLRTLHVGACVCQYFTLWALTHCKIHLYLTKKITNAKVNSEDGRYRFIFLLTYLLQETEAGLWNNTVNLIFFKYMKNSCFFFKPYIYIHKCWHCLLLFLHDMQSMWNAFLLHISFTLSRLFSFCFK